MKTSAMQEFKIFVVTCKNEGHEGSFKVIAKSFEHIHQEFELWNVTGVKFLYSVRSIINFKENHT